MRGSHPRVHQSASTYWAPAWNQGHWCEGLIVLVQYLRKAVFVQSPHLGNSVRHQAAWPLEPKPSPSVFPLERRPSSFVWVKTSLGTFLDYVRLGSYLSAKANHPPMTWEGVLFEEALFLWEGSFWTLKGAELPHTALPPKFFTSQLFNKRWKQILRQMSHNFVECLYPRDISCPSNYFPVSIGVALWLAHRNFHWRLKDVW